MSGKCHEETHASQHLQRGLLSRKSTRTYDFEYPDFVIEPLECAAAQVLKFYIRPSNQILNRARDQDLVGVGRRDHSRCHVNGDAVHVVCSSFYLADMQSGAHVDTD